MKMGVTEMNDLHNHIMDLSEGLHQYCDPTDAENNAREGMMAMIDNKMGGLSLDKLERLDEYADELLREV